MEVGPHLASGHCSHSSFSHAHRKPAWLALTATFLWPAVLLGHTPLKVRRPARFAPKARCVGVEGWVRACPGHPLPRVLHAIAFVPCKQTFHLAGLA